MTTAAWRRALGSVAVAIVGLGAGATSAAAEEPAALGWWWVGRPSAMLPALLAPVPSVPEGGLYVAGDVTGPSGISALRFTLPSGASATALTLTIVATSGTPVIDACAAGEAWEPAENGGWDRRPEPDCHAASVTGTVDADRTEVSFALSQLQDEDGILDLVLVPGVDPGTERPASFATSFAPPDAEVLAVGEPAATDTSSSTSTSPTPGRVPPPPTYEVPALPSALPPRVPAPGDAETAAPPRASASEPTAIATTPSVIDTFAYPAVLALPLVLLAAGSYLAWALTRPIAVRGVSLR